MGISMFDFDTEAVRARYENAMGKRATLDDADAALADIPVLLSEISRLEARLREAAQEIERLRAVSKALSNAEREAHFECEGWKSIAKSNRLANEQACAVIASLTPPSVSPVSSGEAKE